MMCFDPISYDKAEKARKHSENVQEQLNQHKLDYALLKDNFNSLFIDEGDPWYNLFDYSVLKQGGISPAGHSTSSKRTTAYPIILEPTKNYMIKIVSENIRIRSIIRYKTESINNGIYILTDGVYTEHQFTVPTGTIKIAISFCKTDTDLDITVEETNSAKILLWEVL